MALGSTWSSSRPDGRRRSAQRGTRTHRPAVAGDRQIRRAGRTHASARSGSLAAGLDSRRSGPGTGRGSLTGRGSQHASPPVTRVADDGAHRRPGTMHARATTAGDREGRPLGRGRSVSAAHRRTRRGRLDSASRSGPFGRCEGIHHRGVALDARRSSSVYSMTTAAGRIVDPRPPHTYKEEPWQPQATRRSSPRPCL
jgi:hypothetical protein